MTKFPITEFAENPIRKDLLDFFYKERDLVHRELESVKTSRATIFMSTLAFLSSSCVAIYGVVESAFKWLPLITVMPIVFLIIVILTIITRDREINERNGYLEAIEELKNAGMLEKMKGWILSYSTNRKCYLHCYAGKFPHKCPFSNNSYHCTTEGRNKAREEINRYVRLIPRILNSLTSLFAYVYGFAYFVAVGVFLWSIVSYINFYLLDRNSTEINTANFWLIVMAGSIVTTFIVILSITGSSAMAHLLRWMRNIGFAIIPSLVIGCVVLLNFDTSVALTVKFAYVIGGFVAVFSVLIAYLLLGKANSLRRGRYAIDCWRHVWKIRFERCPLLNPQS